MRRLVLIVLTLLALLGSVQAQTTQTTLQALIVSDFPDNTVGAITPLILRTFLASFVSSYNQYGSSCPGTLSPFQQFANNNTTTDTLIQIWNPGIGGTPGCVTWQTLNQATNSTQLIANSVTGPNASGFTVLGGSGANAQLILQSTSDVSPGSDSVAIRGTVTGFQSTNGGTTYLSCTVAGCTQNTTSSLLGQLLVSSQVAGSCTPGGSFGALPFTARTGWAAQILGCGIWNQSASTGIAMEALEGQQSGSDPFFGAVFYPVNNGSGNTWGINAICELISTGYCVGDETDLGATSAATNASSQFVGKAIEIAGGPGATQGSSSQWVALTIGTELSGGAWQYGIDFGSAWHFGPAAAVPFNTSSTIIHGGGGISAGNCGSACVGTGIDFSDYYFSSCIFKIFNESAAVCALNPNGAFQSSYMGIGVAANTAYDIGIQRTTTSAPAYGILINDTISNSTTNSYNGFTSGPQTAAASFTVTNVRDFYAYLTAKGSGSSITNQYGFFADSSLVGASNNYGFYSALNAASGVYAFYGSGTAASQFNGNVTVNSASFALSGNISAASWTTNGIRYANAAGTLIDTTGSDTQANVYNSVWGGDTDELASGSATWTNLYGNYFKTPTCSNSGGGTLTCTNVYALGVSGAIQEIQTLIGGNVPAGGTSYDGLILNNTTVATSGTTVQNSPNIHLIGNAWNGSTSQTADWLITNQPSSVASGTITGNLLLSYQLNGGGYFPAFNFGSAGFSTAGDTVLTINSPSGSTATGVIMQVNGTTYGDFEATSSALYITPRNSANLVLQNTASSIGAEIYPSGGFYIGSSPSDPGAQNLVVAGIAAIKGTGTLTPASGMMVGGLLGGGVLTTGFSSGYGALYTNATYGTVLQGSGSSFDVTLVSSAGGEICGVLAGSTTTLECLKLFINTGSAITSGDQLSVNGQISVGGLSNLGASSTDYVKVTGGSSGATISTNGGSLAIQANATNFVSIASSGAATLYNQPTTGTITYAVCAASGANGTGGGAIILDTSLTVCGLSSMLYKRSIAAFDVRGMTRLAALDPTTGNMASVVADVNPLAEIMRLAPAQFRGTGDPIIDTGLHFGLMAQDACDVDDRLCARFPDGSPRAPVHAAVEALTIAAVQQIVNACDHSTTDFCRELRRHIANDNAPVRKASSQ